MAGKMFKVGRRSGISQRASAALLDVSVEAREQRQFSKTAKRMIAENTSSPDIARQKLRDMGILTASGRLSKNYK
ncbi:MAG: hypothetical protein NW205_03845 [Hyphomicrobiaceae bacterium]|nr:hypothetical protein [Hyphomicrobiaceae bacterium]